jgi:hypothetical protein
MSTAVAVEAGKDVSLVLCGTTSMGFYQKLAYPEFADSRPPVSGPGSRLRPACSSGGIDSPNLRYIVRVVRRSSQVGCGMDCVESARGGLLASN